MLLVFVVRESEDGRGGLDDYDEEYINDYLETYLTEE